MYNWFKLICSASAAFLMFFLFQTCSLSDVYTEKEYFDNETTIIRKHPILVFEKTNDSRIPQLQVTKMKTDTLRNNVVICYGTVTKIIQHDFYKDSIFVHSWSYLKNKNGKRKKKIYKDKIVDYLQLLDIENKLKVGDTLIIFKNEFPHEKFIYDIHRKR